MALAPPPEEPAVHAITGYHEPLSPLTLPSIRRPVPIETAEIEVRENGAAVSPDVPAARLANHVSFSWWLWPHLLSLDAPLVAVVWQLWWAKSSRVELPRHATWILALGVWTIYLADRLADTATPHREIPSTVRHAFHARWRVVLLPVVVVSVCMLALTTPSLLERHVFLNGLVLLAFTGGYFWLIHQRRFRAWQSGFPKEAIVGCMFALGTAFFPCCHGAMDQACIVVAVALFAGLCACNCALITRWECNAQDWADPVSLLNAFPAALPLLGWLALSLGGLGGLLWLAGRTPVFAPIFVSGILLGGLDFLRHRLPLPALRVLADIALLTPLLTFAL